MSKKFVPHKEDTKCAVSKKYDGTACYTLDSLIRMAVSFNVKCSKTKQGNPIDIIEDKKYLVKEITKRVENVCSDQICWLTQDFVKELNDAEINENTFLPKITQGKFDWLNTTNIKAVMQQYETTHKDFKFFGAVPLDFDDLPELGIRNINFDELKAQGKSKLGFVFNFDKHYQNGSHWVSMFCDIKRNQIYYFDSYGTRPKKQIAQLVNRIATWCYKRNVLKSNAEMSDSAIEDSFMHPNKKNCIEKQIGNIKFNQNRHQFKNSECGVYSINFIIRLLKGETFEHICDNITTDDEINLCRAVYFRFK